MAQKETEIVNTRWLNNMAFETEVNGHKIVIDAKEEVGGRPGPDRNH